MSKAIACRTGALFLALALAALPVTAAPEAGAAPGGWWQQTVEWLSSVVSGLEAPESIVNASDGEAPAAEAADPVILGDTDESTEPPSGEAYPYLDPNG